MKKKTMKNSVLHVMLRNHGHNFCLHAIILEIRWVHVLIKWPWDIIPNLYFTSTRFWKTERKQLIINLIPFNFIGITFLVFHILWAKEGYSKLKSQLKCGIRVNNTMSRGKDSRASVVLSRSNCNDNFDATPII